MNFVNCQAQLQTTNTIEKIVLDETDKEFGYYFLVRPKEKIKSVLLLLPGFGQKSEDIFLDTKYHEIAIEKNILVVGFAGRTKLTCDEDLSNKINLVINDVLSQTNIENINLVIGGFSAGGVIALRYTELCYQFPQKYPLKPQGVFMADSPVDLFHSWKLQEENLLNNYSEISKSEAEWMTKYYKGYYGATPSENPKLFMNLSPFSIDKRLGENEKYLKNVSVRAYHDIDVSWRLINRNQTAKFDNYIATAELINRLILMGNKKAEFIQTFETGYRRDGKRHPHSWSIINEHECIEWINGLEK